MTGDIQKMSIVTKDGFYPEKLVVPDKRLADPQPGRSSCLVSVERACLLVCLVWLAFTQIQVNQLTAQVERVTSKCSRNDKVVKIWPESQIAAEHMNENHHIKISENPMWMNEEDIQNDHHGAISRKKRELRRQKDIVTDGKKQTPSKKYPNRKRNKDKNRKKTKEERKARKERRKTKKRKNKRSKQCGCKCKTIKKCVQNKIEKAIKRVKNSLRTVQVHFVPKEVKAITNHNDAKLTTDYGTLINGTIKPNNKQRYTLWSQEMSPYDRDGHLTQGVFKYEPRLGILSVNETGMYLIYAQMLYHDEGPRSSYAIRHKRDKLGSNFTKIVTCLESPGQAGEASDGFQHDGYHMCSTNTVVRLEKGDMLDTYPMYVGQAVIPDKAATFWGIVLMR